MIELLSKYSVSEILVFMVLLATAFKAVSSFLDWARQKRHDKVIEEMKPEELSKSIKEERQQREKQLQEMEDAWEHDRLEIQDSVNEIAYQVSGLAGKIDLLVESDKDDIKAYITREYHYFCEQKGWIDDYSMDCIERRYDHYVEERGNSFIGGMMDKLRALPRTEPKD